MTIFVLDIALWQRKIVPLSFLLVHADLEEIRKK